MFGDHAGTSSMREELEILGLLGDAWGSCDPFDEAAHGELLVDLWHAAFGNETAFERRSSRWETIGFQSSDPVTDLRGCGALGLQHILDFVKSGAGAATVRQCQSGALRFPLAAASLNVTLMLAVHFNMTAPAPVSAHPPPCSMKTLQNAVRLQLSTWLDAPASHSSCDEDGFSRLTCGATRATSLLALMHAQLLRRLADRWAAETSHLDAAASGAHLLMHFPKQLAETREHMVSALARVAAPWDVRTVLVALRAADPPQRDVRVVAARAWTVLTTSRRPLNRPCPSFFRLASAAFTSMLAS